MHDAYGATIVGATGAVGGAVVRALLDSPRCDRIVALVRRPVTAFDAHPHRAKLALAVVDFAALEHETAQRAAGCDVGFCTVGIGQPRKVSEAEFRRVDVEYAGAFARGAVKAGVRHLALLSAVSSNADARNRYVRVKGEAERAVIDAGADRTSIFRPSVLATDEIRYGVQDRITQAAFALLSPVLPTRWRRVHVNDLGRAMVADAERRDAAGVTHRYWHDYQTLLHGGDRTAP